ncbi:MAG: NlpC/P60 family protein [Micrococcaceae bacterium]|nr:NlpC/P60 family protein [Micrococcaceae bacterium]
MSIIKSVVVLTSAALIASGALTATGSPASTPSGPAQQAASTSTHTDPSLLSVISKSLETARLTPAKNSGSLDRQLAAVQTALQDAEAATLEATENAVVAQESAAQDQGTAASLAGTSLASLGQSQAQVERHEAADLARKAQGLFSQAEDALNTAHQNLVVTSAALHKTTVEQERVRLAKRSETREDAELMAALENSEANVPDPVNDPAVDPEMLENAQSALGALGSASVASAAGIHVPAKKLTRTARINKSVKWATKIAKNNKYKYRYGATGPTYFDCSGYVGKAYAQGGKKLKRTSSSQYKAAPKKVKLSKMKKGDLVFWSSNRGRSFYHVAIYMGKGKIAHARNPKAGISVTKLNYAGTRNIYKYAGRY